MEKKKKDLWPLVKQYVHPETAIIRHYKSGQSSSLISSGKWICRSMALKHYRRSRLNPIGKVNYVERNEDSDVAELLDLEKIYMDDDEDDNDKEWLLQL
ncbi:hypothetical protein CEXT_139391 [Caerostris extrusa]|uniref:Uncharacterized protein n=1 Tax=Caerostris extrusa TaxID=172846 RepID=A0AAV4NNU4_CAEEX|nr:hypothetical protein CEXT_139391 [Caerostris extrusa]